MANEQLLIETKKLVKLANQRLLRLEKTYGTTEVWAGKRLKKMVEARQNIAPDIMSKTGRLKANKKMSDAELLYIQYITRNFIKSKTSTLSGIKATEKNIKKGLKERWGVNQVEDDDIDDFYDLLGDETIYNNFRDLIGSSDLWIVVREAKEQHESINDFASRLNSFARFSDKDTNSLYDELPDNDVKSEIERLYNKYVKF